MRHMSAFKFWVARPKVSYAENAPVVAPEEFAKLAADIEEYGGRPGLLVHA